MLCNPQFFASENIEPSRFVLCDPATGKNFYVIRGDSGDVSIDNTPVGISQEGTQDPPGVTGSGAYAGTAGHEIDIYGLGDVCLLEIGTGGCLAGQLLKPDTAGKGIILDSSSGGDQFYGARALQTCSEGDLCRVQVLQGFYTS